MESRHYRKKMSGDPTDTRRYAVTGLDSVKLATEASDGVARRAPERRDVTGDKIAIAKNTSIRDHHRIGAWNVRGLLKTGKLSIVEKEMGEHRLSILCVSETHMRDNGHFTTASGNVMYFSGAKDSSANGVGVILPPKINAHVLGYNPVSDRILTLKLNTKPCKLNIVSVYAPTAQSSEEEIDSFYGTLEETLNALSGREVTMILGDFNAKIGSTVTDDHIRQIVGKYGLGERNERGERFLEFCISKGLSILNTCFQHHPRRLYTWKSPGDRYRNQIDYILLSTRWKSSVANVKTFPGADCGSDHNLLVAFFRLRLKSCKKPTPKLRCLDLSERPVFQNSIESKLIDHPPPQDADANTQWRALSTHITDTLDVIIKERRTDRKKRTWISNDTWELIQRRKNLKAEFLKYTDSDRTYTNLSSEIQRRCRWDKNNFIASVCQDIEDHSRKYQTADLFKKVRVLTRQFKPKTWSIEDTDGHLIYDLEGVAERWRNYCSQLYSRPCSDTNSPLIDWKELELEPEILRSEVDAALKRLKPLKAPGPDQITAEVLSTLGDRGMEALHMICDTIWRTGIWPTDWAESIIIPLHKKGSKAKCDNYRTLSLISHASKILLHIINCRIRHFLDWQIPQEQAGFVKGRGTREQILNIRQLIEKAYEFDTPMILCFVDYCKAFDCVNWGSLWRVLLELGVPKHLTALLQTLYNTCQSTVRIEDTLSKPFKPEKGVRQGCILSPILFNAYGEYIMRKSCDGWDGGVSVGGVKISNLRYADDTTLLAANEDELKSILERMERISRDLGLAINRSKTKIMVVDRFNSIQLSGTLDLEVVDSFIYLGSTVSKNGSCEAEVRGRIGMSKNAMTQLLRIWKDRNISLKTKSRLVRTLVFSIFLYGVETWTLKAADRKRIDAFEMWCWRRMLRIPWTARRTNASILKKLNVKTRLSTICLQRILEYFGHIARKDGDNLEKLIVTGKIEGKRPRGRSPIRWSDQVRTTLESNKLYDALHAAEDRHRWRNIVRRKVIHGSGHDPQN